MTLGFEMAYGLHRSFRMELARQALEQIRFQKYGDILRDYCTACATHSDQPSEHHAIVDLGFEIARIYEECFPKRFADNLQNVHEATPSEWIMPGTPFTVAILNKNSGLPEHRDSQNYRGALSCMVVFRKDIDGGKLFFPDYGTEIEMEDSSYFIFDGQSVRHAVTDMALFGPHGYRYSVVYYGLQARPRCLAAPDECKTFEEFLG